MVHTKSEKALATRKLALELLMGDHDGDCQGPCKLNCPAHTDCQKYVKEIAEGRFADAVATASAKRPSAISFTYFWQSVCAGQLSLQGPWQSPSWSPIRSSSASLRVASAFSLFVCTTMPCETFAEQARSIFGQFSTSTTHTPHAP